MPTLLIAYIATAAVFLVLDIIWLGIIARGFYAQQLAGIVVVEVKTAWALAFYLAYVAGIVIFAVRPALTSEDWRTALLFGALFGFFCYATYDFTNMATIKGWPMKMVLIDVVWGTILTGLSAGAGYLLTRAVPGAVSG